MQRNIKNIIIIIMITLIFSLLFYFVADYQRRKIKKERIISEEIPLINPLFIRGKGRNIKMLK